MADLGERCERHCLALGRKRGALALLHKVRARAFQHSTERQLMRHCAAAAADHYLQQCPGGALPEQVAIVERRRSRLAVDVARNGILLQVAEVDSARDEQIIAHEAAGTHRQESELVLDPVGPGIGAPRVVEHRRGQRLRALHRVVGERERYVQVRARVLPSRLDEPLAQPARRVLAPAPLVQRTHRREVVGALAVPAALAFEELAAEGAAREPCRLAGKCEARFGVDRQHAKRPANRGNRFQGVSIASWPAIMAPSWSRCSIPPGDARAVWKPIDTQ